MKQVYKRVLAIALMCLFFVAKSYAYDFKSNGLRFNVISEEDRTVEVTYDGSGTSNRYYIIGQLTIPKKVSNDSKTYTVIRIGNSAFYYCTELTSVTIPNSVTTIGKSAFGYCEGLTSVTIPNSVTTIGDYAFDDCTGLTSVTIPNSVETVGINPFRGCKLASLGINGSHPYLAEDGYVLYSKDKTRLIGCFNPDAEEVSIPNSVTTIGDYAFYYCTGLTSVEIGNSVTSIGDYAFFFCKGLTSVAIPNSVTTIGKYAFYYCPGLTSVTISNSVTTIGKYAFGHCEGLTSVTIPNSVTTIGASAFYYCTGLTSVTIPNSVTTIGASAFYNCEGLTSVEIGNSVTTIGDKAFYYCPGLTSVTIPNSVTTIGKSAFIGCNGLEYIDCMGITPPTAYESSWSVYSRAILYVPKGSLNAYETTWPWSNFYDIMEKEFSGIDDLDADTTDVTVTVDGGCIRVAGIDEGSDIEVYDMTGRRVYVGMGPSIEGLSSGAYVVRVAGRPYKVMVR